MRRRFLQVLPRNFFTAFSVLLAFKLGLVGNNIFGTEAFESGAVFLSKIPLLIGNDVLGALIFAALLSLPAAFLAERGFQRAGTLTAGVLQGGHSLLVGISFFACVYVGGPLNKEVIELAGGGASPLGNEDPAIWSSIACYIGPGQVSTVLGGVLLGTLVYLFFPEIAKKTGPRLKKLVVGVLAAKLLLGVFILPWLINGHIMGIRIHTFGLERSPGIELGWPYIKPAFSWMKRSGPQPEDEFKLDLTSINLEGEKGVVDPIMTRAVSKQTNIIFISLESVASVYLEEEPSRMPFLTGTAKEGRGVYFENHYTVWPQTMKAFFSMHCSELPYPTYKSISFVNPSIPCVSLSQVLKGQGYYTALITSADLAYDRKKRFFRHRDFDLLMDMREMPGRDQVWGDSWGLDDRLAVKNVLQLAKKKKDERFFIFYEMVTAHHPYNACQEHEDEPLEEFPAYIRALGYIDDRVRDIVKGISALGLEEDTLIVVASDHGEGFEQHPGARGHGAKVYQENVKVPFALIGPQVSEIAGTASYVTSHLDIAPTVLGLVGAPAPCTMKGRALGKDREAQMALFGGRPPGAQKGLADGKWKYIIEENGMEELFDLVQDPEERKSVLSENVELAKRYRAKIEEWESFSENLIENYSDVLFRSDCRP